MGVQVFADQVIAAAIVDRPLHKRQRAQHSRSQLSHARSPGPTTEQERALMTTSSEELGHRTVPTGRPERKHRIPQDLAIRIRKEVVLEFADSASRPVHFGERVCVHDFTSTDTSTGRGKFHKSRR